MRYDAGRVMLEAEVRLKNHTDMLIFQSRVCACAQTRRLREKAWFISMDETYDMRKDDAVEAQLLHNYIVKAREYVKA